MIKIEALTVCVNYSDFFRHVAKANHKLFDKWVVVTDTKDQFTPEICKEYGLVCIQTDAFYQDGASFNKAAGMNIGLQAISEDAYVLFLDADIILPELTRRAFTEMEYELDVLYGCDRVYLKGYQNFVNYMNSEGVIYQNWLMHGSGLPWGSRIVQYYGIEGEHGKFRGWLPLGFFQMAHRSSFDQIPEGSPRADHYDIAFAMKYPRNKRVLLPEILGVHLESDGHWKGQDWSGRISPPFQPQLETVYEEVPSFEEAPAKWSLMSYIRSKFQ